MIGKYQQEGAGAINDTFDPGCAFQLEAFELHMDATGGAVENLTITIQDKKGPKWNAVYLTQAMAAVSDIVNQPTRPLPFHKGDRLLISYANTNNRVWGMTIKYSILP